MNSTEKARLYWGDNLPDWIRILAEECDKTSQGKVAARIKYSKATISLVLKNDYKGTIAAVEERIRAVLMNSTHECPVFGEILTRDCLFNQAQPFPILATRTGSGYSGPAGNVSLTEQRRMPMFNYRLNGNLAEKIAYLRDRASAIREDNEACYSKIERNRKVLDCISVNLARLEKKAQAEEQAFNS